MVSNISGPVRPMQFGIGVRERIATNVDKARTLFSLPTNIASPFQAQTKESFTRARANGYYAKADQRIQDARKEYQTQFKKANENYNRATLNATLGFTFELWNAQQLKNQGDQVLAKANLPKNKKDKQLEASFTRTHDSAAKATRIALQNTQAHIEKIEAGFQYPSPPRQAKKV